MLALQPTNPQPQAISQVMPQTAVPGLPKYSLVAPSAQAHPLIVYLSNSIKRDVRLLAAMGAIKEPGARVICSYLPHATTADDEADTIAKSLSSAYAFPLATPTSLAEYTASKPAAVSFFSQPAANPANKDPADAKRAIAHAKKLNRQRSETAPLRPASQQRAPSSPRKEKSRHEGLGAKLGAFFNKLTLDSETSPRLRITTPSPRGSMAKLPFPKAPGSSSPLASVSLATLAEEASDEPPRVAHRQTVSYCQTPQGVMQTRQLHEQRKSSQSSQHSATTTQSASDRSSGASTLTVNTRKRSFTHLGLSMESLPSEHPPQSAGPQLRRAKPTANLTTFQAKLTTNVVPTNSLGLVLQSTSVAPKPLPTRAQRHHNSLSVVHKEPKSPTSARVNYGLSSIVSSRYNATAASPLSSKPASAFPPMPSDACQAAMLSGSSAQLSLLAREQKDNRRSQQKPPPVAKALSDSSTDSIASMLVIATSTYDYSSSIKGDLEFVKGERIIVQSKVNDDWWFGSILPESGRGSTGRSGMFPRSHVSFN
ncbi:hypothetical protein GGI06_003398 [Coemansia sp. S85]|nr:hypothetical protein GGI06_003398 [Coemansia sp. S85]